jgi:antimicrobial peptide system SdpB family protein
MEMSNGGDAIAQITTMLLIPMCLGDNRVWQWTSPAQPLAPSWRGSAFAAHLALRVQISLIYLGAVSEKVADPMWQHGSALFVVAYHPQYGFPLPVRDLLAPVLNSYWCVAVLSWSVIVLQVGVALLILGRRRHRIVALVLGCGLHLGIMVLMSLVSFGLVMIALLFVGSASTSQVRRAVRSRTGVPIGVKEEGPA